MPAFVALICQYPPFWEEMRLRTTGTVMRRKLLTADALRAIPIALPPLVEQHRIVELIQSVDDARQILASAVASIRATRQAVLLSMLDDLDAPAQPVESLLSHVIGGAWGQSPGLNDVDVSALGLRAFGDDDVTVSPRFCTSRSLSRDRWVDRALRRDDIILERSGGAEDKPVGRVLLADEDMQSVVPTDFMRLLRVDRSRVLPRFVFWWLWARYQRGDTIAFQAKTTNIRNLRVGDYLRLPILVPARDEQSRVVGVAEAFSHCFFAAQRQAESLARTRSALLDDLLSATHEIPTSYDRFLDGAP
jgi:type I restriction enzyme S subunit